MDIQQFKAQLVKPEAIGAWTYLTVPFLTKDVFASRAKERWCRPWRSGRKSM
jgi:hypothetical protein